MVLTRSRLLFAEGRFDEAQYHFLYSTDGESCAKFLIEYHTLHGGLKHEVDTFVAQMVLQ